MVPGVNEAEREGDLGFGIWALGSGEVMVKEGSMDKIEMTDTYVSSNNGKLC